ncbi:unnamed protein product [Trichobilharzia szidati]|nr:unnamed protein product [Trichobilharzia szidati]CAH8828370.1 unnamed protein product [Trichobilharzia szidati]
MNILLFGIKFIIACLFIEIESIPNEAKLDKPYYDDVSQDKKIEYQFALSNRSEFVIRIHLVNYNPNLDYPILVVIKQVHNVMSFQVPVVLNSIPAYGNVSRTLCPIQVPSGEVRTLTVELSNAMSPPNKVRYMFLAELLHDFDLQPGVEKTMLVSPAEPVYLRYIYPAEKNSAEIKVVSKSDICMVLSIQKLQCPVSDLFDTVGNTGLHQTVTTLGAVSADVTQFPRGFFVVLVLKPTDYACSGMEKIIPVSDEKIRAYNSQIHLPGSRTKSVQIIVRSTPRKWPYLLPILGAVGVYLLFYIVAVILIFLYQRAERRKQFYNEEIINFECGSTCPTVHSIDSPNSDIAPLNTTTISSSPAIATCSTVSSSTINPRISANLVKRRRRFDYGSTLNSDNIIQNNLNSHSLQIQSIPVVDSASYENQVLYDAQSKVSLEDLKKAAKSTRNKKPTRPADSTIPQNSSNSISIFRPSHTGIHHQILSLPQDYQSIALTNSVESNIYCRNSSPHQTPAVETQGFHGWFSSTDEDENDDPSGSNEVGLRRQKKQQTCTRNSSRKTMSSNLGYSKMVGQENPTISQQPIAVISCNNNNNDTNNVSNNNNNTRGGNNDKQQRNLNDTASTSLTEEPIDMNSELVPMYKMNVLLYVSDLSRKRYGTLNRKYLLYFWYLIIISIFYGLPAVQLIMTYQKAVFETGNEDLCYYNFECARPLGIFTAFNNIISNIGYVMLGLLFLGLTARRDIIHRRTKNLNPNSQVLGIPQHYGLFYAMGLALTMEGLMSACYHMCPNFSNFQFDTAYMYILAMLIMLKIYQTRHPDVNASAHSAYMVMAVVIFLGVLGVLYGNQIFWIIFTIFFLIMSVVLTVEIYYMGQWNIDLCLPRRIYHLIRTDGISCFRPTYLERMLLLLIANLVNFTLAGYGIVRRPRDFSTFLLSIFMINLLMYTFFYVIMKLRHRERFQMLSLVYILLACVSWGCAIYFYLSRTTTWEVTPARSRALNQPCVLLDFYDAHDVWHFLSSISMFFSFMLLMYLDDNLSKRPRNQIFVF